MPLRWSPILLVFAALALFGLSVSTPSGFRSKRLSAREAYSGRMIAAPNRGSARSAVHTATQERLLEGLRRRRDRLPVVIESDQRPPYVDAEGPLPNDYRRGPMLIITEDVAEREAGIVDIGPVHVDSKNIYGQINMGPKWIEDRLREERASVAKEVAKIALRQKSS